MKTTIWLPLLVLGATAGISKAQSPHYNHGANSQMTSPSASNSKSWGNPGWSNSYGNSGSVALSWGNPGYAPYAYYGNNYGYSNYNSVKKSARFSLQAAGAVIHDAVGFDMWNDIYSPLVAKAIRHYNYSRQLYLWHDYAGALNHAERARYLAWYSLQYFQNPAYYNANPAGGYPNPYSDPYNPYYKNAAPGNAMAARGSSPQENSDGRERQPEASPGENAIDRQLPGNGASDRELIRAFKKTDRPADE